MRLIQFLGEGAVYLDHAQRKAVHMSKRGEAGSKIVQRRTHTGVLQALQNTGHGRRIAQQRTFSHLYVQLGHIKAGHVLYTVIARNIADIVAIVGQATFGIGTLLGQGLVLALHDWYRKAELTCDRAGLLCVQEIDPCIRTFMKLAGGARQLYSEMDKQEFLRQIREYEAADVSTLNKAYKVLITAYRTHPFPILRAKELDAWHSSGYRTLAGPLGLLKA